ncbi:MAG TPA: class I SAM-dependent methyltransferase [Candidatus Obscuribacterales bacterium]
MTTSTRLPARGYDPKHFSMLAEAEPANFWFRSRNKLILWALQQFAPGARNFLEIGCGTGFVLQAVAARFPQLEIYGSELFAEGLSFAARRVPTARLLELDARDIRFDSRFDAIGMFDVLEHIDDDRLVLEQVFKALTPGGTMFISVPQHRFLWGPSDVSCHHYRRYEKQELVSKVQQAGFNVLATTSFVSLLLPLMIASRWCQRRFCHRHTVMSELQVRGLLGAFLEGVLSFELFLVRRGLSWPAGGSLFLVAHKPL